MGERTIATFFDAWELFAPAATSGAIVGSVLGALGVFVVLRRMVFLSAALSQISSLGLVLAWFLGVGAADASHAAGPSAVAFLVTFAAALVLSSERLGESIGSEVMLGIAYLLGTAGTLALGTRVVQELHDVDSLLIGSAVAVVPSSLRLLMIVGAFLAIGLLVFHRGFFALAIDPIGARIRGLPVRVLQATLLLMLAIGISVSTRILGALSVFAFSVLPGLAAVRLSRTLPTALVLAAVLGAFSGFGGYVAAYLFDLPVGASQTLLGLVIVLIVEAARAVHLVIKRYSGLQSETKP